MPKDHIIYKETYRKGALRMTDHESLTNLQKIPHFKGRVMSADVLAVAKVDRAGTKLEYIDLRVWVAPYSTPAAKPNPNDPDRE